MAVLVTFLVLGFVIFIHELGHLVVAKYSGIGVYEFSVGMGPKIIGFSYKQTDYNLRLLPFGGFVKLAGLDEALDDKVDEACYFQNRPIKSRMFTIVAGSLMNILFGFLVFLWLMFVQGVSSTTIDFVEPNSPAAMAGIQVGDEVIALNDEPVKNIKKDFLIAVQKGEESYSVTLQREDQQFSVMVSPYFDEAYKLFRFGIRLELQRGSFYAISRSFSNAIELTGMSIGMVFKSIGMLFNGQATINDLSGPVGIIQIASFQFSESLMSFFNLMAFISITLGVMNLFPIPVLDGGHLVMLLFEALFKKPPPVQFIKVLNGIFVVFLIGLTAVVLINDVTQWSSRVDMLNELSSDD